MVVLRCLQDSTVRICDCTSRRCVSIISLHDEQLLQEGDLAELLRCAKAPPVTCVKFDAGGNWLVAGNGQAGIGSEQQGGLTLWNCSLNAAAKHKSTGKCMPQVGLGGVWLQDVQHYVATACWCVLPNLFQLPSMVVVCGFHCMTSPDSACVHYIW
jgi:hypothetical protein